MCRRDMKLAQFLSAIAAATCWVLSTASVNAVSPPQGCATPQLNDTSDWNARVAVTCTYSEEGQGSLSVSAKFLADNIADYTAYIAFNCSNGTHYKVTASPSSGRGFDIIYYVDGTIDSKAIDLVNLSGNVECTIFGCYKVITDDDLIPVYNFATVSDEGICSIDTHPSLSTASVTSSYILETSLSAMTISYAEIIPAVTASSLNSHQLTSLIITSQASYPVSTQHPQPAHIIWGPLLVAPVFVLITLSCIILVSCMVIARKRWKKNKLLTDLRTGYGLQKRDQRFQKVYSHISETLDIAFSEPQAKYESTKSIIDLFNYNTIELSGFSAAYGNSDDSVIETEIQQTLSAALKAGFTLGEQADEMMGYIEHTDPPPPYVTSLVYDSEYAVTSLYNPGHTAVPVHQQDSPLLLLLQTANTVQEDAVVGGYVEPLSYTTNQVVNAERENVSLSCSVCDSSTSRDNGYIEMSELAPIQQDHTQDTTRDAGPDSDTQYQCNSQGYVANY